MMERVMLETSYATKKMERMRLATEAQKLISAVKIIIQPASVTPLAALNVDDALDLMKNLQRVKKRYDAVTAEIAEIKRELGIDED
jgi:hypothetical protein